VTRARGGASSGQARKMATGRTRRRLGLSTLGALAGVIAMFVHCPAIAEPDKAQGEAKPASATRLSDPSNTKGEGRSHRLRRSEDLNAAYVTLRPLPDAAAGFLWPNGEPEGFGAISNRTPAQLGIITPADQAAEAARLNRSSLTLAPARDIYAPPVLRSRRNDEGEEDIAPVSAKELRSRNEAETATRPQSAPRSRPLQP